MTVMTRGSGAGFDLTLELATDALIPGRLVDGSLRIASRDGNTFRGARVALEGIETYRYDKSTTDSEGRTHTETVTEHEDLPKVPVALLGPTTIAPGGSVDVPFQIPVPSLGPPTFEGTELRVDWTVHANLDVPGFDPAAEMSVRVLQPTALLRAGVIDVAQFALFDEVASEADGLRGTIRLEPMPLCVDAPFKGRLTMERGAPRKVQQVRLELRVTARATVSGGREETLTLWAAELAPEGDFGGAERTYEFEDTLSGPCLPTIRTPHGQADATFHVVVAVAWAPDPHLIRDVAIASTTEI